MYSFCVFYISDLKCQVIWIITDVVGPAANAERKHTKLIARYWKRRSWKIVQVQLLKYNMTMKLYSLEGYCTKYHVWNKLQLVINIFLLSHNSFEACNCCWCRIWYEKLFRNSAGYRKSKKVSLLIKHSRPETRRIVHYLDCPYSIGIFEIVLIFNRQMTTQECRFPFSKCIN